jgi:4'-phosphopantetheinyl transferase
MDSILAVNQLEDRFPESGTVDIWRLSLGGSQHVLADVLSDDERQRAGRFHFERDRSRFVRCRAWLRNVLGGYLGLDAAMVRFDYGERGKPFAAAAQNGRNIQFNLAHSGEFAVLAVTSSNQVGVDIEQIERLRDEVKIAQRFFSDRESAELEALPEGIRHEGFAACWTRKEAFIKALGTGLSLPLSEFSVTVHPQETPRIIEVQMDLRAANWWLTDLRAPSGCRAALVAERGPCALRECPTAAVG